MIYLMQPNAPVGPQPESSRPFTEEALNKKFSYSFTRKQLIVLINILHPIQLPLNDLRNRVLLGVLDEIEKTAIQSITDSDYMKLPPPAAPPTNTVQIK